MNKMKSTFDDILQTKGINGNENLVFYEDNIASLKGVSCRAYYMMNLFGFNNQNLYIL